MGRKAEIFFRVKGEKLSILKLSKRYNITTSVLYQRLVKHKWTLKKAVSLPVRSCLRYGDK